MSLTDPVSDLLTRIRNGIDSKHESITLPSSKLKLEIVRILKEEGYQTKVINSVSSRNRWSNGTGKSISRAIPKNVQQL